MRTRVSPRHQAVGVENDHVGVAAAPSTAEVGDIAALALGVFGAVAIEDPAESVDFPAPRMPGQLFGDPGFGVGGVAEDVEIEPLVLAGSAKRGVDGRQSPKHGFRIFIVDRNDDGRAVPFGAVGQGRVRCTGPKTAPIAAAGEHDEPRRRRPERQGDPTEQQGEQRQQGQFGRLESVDLENRGQNGGSRNGAGNDQSGQQRAAHRRFGVRTDAGSVMSRSTSAGRRTGVRRNRATTPRPRRRRAESAKEDRGAGSAWREASERERGFRLRFLRAFRPVGAVRRFREPFRIAVRERGLLGSFCRHVRSTPCWGGGTSPHPAKTPDGGRCVGPTVRQSNTERAVPGSYSGR